MPSASWPGHGFLNKDVFFLFDLLSLPLPSTPALCLPKAGTHPIKSKGSLSFRLTLGPGS